MMNLILCYTPLQVLIAERIIDLHSDEEFYGVLWTYSDNDKFRYYFDRLKRKCRGRGYYVFADEQEDKGRFGFSRLLNFRFSELVCRLVRPYPDRVYLANIDHPFFFSIIPNDPKIEVFTFDDGTKNLFGTYTPGHTQLGKLGRLLGFSTEESLFARHKKHYSIFPYPNTMPSVERISLYDDSVTLSSRSGSGDEVSIFLGQPLYDREPLCVEEVCYRTVARAVQNQYNPGYYLPHPRERFRIEGIEYIDTPLIFEDYILRELEAHPNREYVVYTYCSTSVLNLQGIPRLRFVALKPSNCPEYLLDIYGLFDRLGVETRDIEVDDAHV